MKNMGLSILLVLCSFGGQVTAQKQPKIIVGIVIDQMCYDYLYRFQHHFGSGGFNRFLNKGLNCRNTLYNYVPTYTGPGHASIYTGTTPSNHGIVANDWYQRQTKTMVNCVFDPSVQTIGSISLEGQSSPKNLRTYTVTDQLKMSSPESKVISVSIKDRSAILPGGHLSDGSYWYDYSSGKFITSTYYKSELPKWLSQFNESKNADKYLKKWDLLYPKTNYKSIDESPYEVILGGKKTATFPYDFKEMALVSNNANKLFTVSPFANELLTDLAIEAIAREKLGVDHKPDMLCISYSTPDIAGHAFGPYSLEMEDMYARLDRQLEKLLSHLESQFGKDGFVVFLTADHAVVPVPQMLVDLKMPGGYLFLNERLASLRSVLVSQFGADLIEKEENQNIYLNRTLMDSLKLNAKNVSEVMVEYIRQWPEVKLAITKSALISGNVTLDEWGQMIQKGFDLERSGDLIFMLQPGYLAQETDEPKAHTGTSHGSAFNYDTHVPLLWYGANISAKDCFRPIQIVDIAPTLIHLLNLQRSGAMTGTPILEILDK
jgi:predicted AlkP superfamily pyrophosphatase or phosphodiesterase